MKTPAWLVYERCVAVMVGMCASNNSKIGYIKCLVAATPLDQTVEGDRPKEQQTLTAEDISRIEHEMGTLGRDFRAIEESHGRNTLHLVIATAYLRKLLDNVRIVRFLVQNHPEVMAEFQKLVDNRSLREQAAAQ